MFLHFFKDRFLLYSTGQTGSQQIAQASFPTLTSQCWDDRHVSQYSEKTYYPKTALIQVLTSVWPKKQSKVQPNYNNLGKAAESSYSQRLSMREETKYAPWNYFSYLFSCMKAAVEQANIAYFKASLSAYKYLPNSSGGLCLLKCPSWLRACFNYRLLGPQ